jgi:hypothetical protein
MRWTNIRVAVQWVASGPVGRLGGRISLGGRHNTLGHIRPEWWGARRSCLITQKTVVTRLHEAFLPAPHTGLRLADPAHNGIGADAVCAQQDDLGLPDMLTRALRSRATALGRRRSTGLRKIEIPVRIGQTFMQRARRESLPDSNVRFDLLVPILPTGRPRKRSIGQLPTESPGHIPHEEL